MCFEGNRLFARALALFIAGLVGIGLASVVAAPPASAEPVLPAGFALRDLPSGQQAGDLTDFAYLPDGSVLSTGKSGTVAWVSTTGQSRTLAKLPVLAEQDLGLVGLAVAPDYASSRHIYLARSVPTAGGAFELRLSRWTVTGSEPTGLAAETPLLRLPGDSNVHAMTGIEPADDGTLWVSIGDNASYTRADPLALRALDPNAAQGKILHITADGSGVASNPYYDAANPDATRSKVFASGFRSPFRLSLDPRTGLPVVGDVGWNAWEEIDVVQPGRNYGWPCWEAREPTPGYRDMPQCAGVGNTEPLVAMPHGSGTDNANSFTGGIVYTGNSYPQAYRGAYFFGDYTHQKLWSVHYDGQGRLTQGPQSPPLGTGVGRPVSFAAAPNGDIVYADIGSGTLKRLTYTDGNQAPVAKATTTTDPETRTVTFDAAGSHDFDGDPLTYHWDFGDGQTASGPNVRHTYAEGTERFTATLTVTDSLGASSSTQVTVVPGNHTPVIEAQTPGDRTFAVGEPVRLNATATDAEDGPLGVHWQATVLHCPEEATCHAHPTESADGSTFEQPFTDHPDSRMEFTATATDSQGVATTFTYTAWPREHRLALDSNVPAALEIASEGGGGGSSTGRSATQVTEGAQVSVSAAAVALDGVSEFAEWADGSSERVRTFEMADADVVLTALYSTPVAQRYASDPDVRSVLGEPTGPEVIEGGVYYRTYENGRLYWTQPAGTHEVHGPLADKYVGLGAHRALGAPTTDQRTTPDGAGRYNHFEGRTVGLPASVYWTPETGAHGIWGAIRQRWAALGWERGPLGYPTTDESVTPDGVGRYNHFSKAASVYWTPSTGAHGVWGAIRSRWRAMGWERGRLGYPTTDESVTPDGVGRYNHFSKAASVYWTPSTGAHSVYGAIRSRWRALGWERSYLGYPTTDEFSVNIGRRGNFQRGYIVWNSSTGAVTDRRY
ncbi:glucose/sorbosone dehydrogenase [Saccharomonospora marina XMU15]|uniref:Glucose/sorbosone dehydrogenase n=1 Tax=Saccharomonospora marina XMU15 TaxID=882083 RepID=H5X433_9PSEU|nr:PQQ-dependent sugar dehydrogenase [Saccharomonospora marina]EHR53304.1 glucose/sorbosone dehydrogenase [Saccharomonospora marina XMU15]